MYFCNPHWLSCRADNSGLLFIEERIFLSFQLFSIKSTQYDTCRYTFNLSIGQALYNAFRNAFSSSIRRSANAKPKCNFSLSSFRSFSDITLYFIKSFNVMYMHFHSSSTFSNNYTGCFAIICQ